MINRELFYKKMKEAKELIGSKITKESVDLIYEKIHANYTDNDFEKAVFSAMSEGDIYYPNLVRWLEYYKELRIEKETKKQKEQEKRELRELKNRQVKEPCKYDYKCNQCPKQYCGILNYYGFRGIEAVLSGNREILKQAAEMFPDIWGKYKK